MDIFDIIILAWVFMFGLGIGYAIRSNEKKHKRTITIIDAREFPAQKIEIEIDD